MKRTILAVLAALGVCAASGAMETLVLSEGETSPGISGVLIGICAVSTNLTGTVQVDRITPLDLPWEEERLVATTNYTYETIPYRWAVTNEVVATNGAEVVVTTNETWESAWRTVTNMHVRAQALKIPRVEHFEWTNTLISGTMNNGTNALWLSGQRSTPKAQIFDGDIFSVTGTAFPGGKVLLLIER